MARCSRDSCRRWRPESAVRLLGLGLKVDGAWFCSDRCVEADATRRLEDVRTREVSRQTPSLRLGTVLLQQNGVTARHLTDALRVQRQSGLKLGDQLQKLGYSSREAVLRALAAQSGVRYLSTIDQSSVRSTPGHLSSDEVRALGIVPFSENGDRLQVACTAPVPYAALDAVTTLIGRTVEPYLVSDEDFERLQSAYVEGSDGSVTTTTVKDIKAGASQIAGLVAEAGDVTMKEANLDAYTWVRIAANGRISTLLVPPYPQQLEEHDAWLAATTRH
jgi:hypothetical protein